ncbi:transcriptional regulator [Actinosynnema sp. NPDC059797]
MSSAQEPLPQLDWTASIDTRVGSSQYWVRLRTEKFGRVVELAGFRSDYALARAMGLNRSTVTRVRTGQLQPGRAFISGALKALVPMEFDDLFEVEENW